MLTNKLYPPRIEGALPAAVCVSDIEGLTVSHKAAFFDIPMFLNPGVKMSDIGDFYVLFKEITKNKVIFGCRVSKQNYNNNILHFSLLEILNFGFQENFYYKVQVACISQKNVLGYYSSPGVVKLISPPSLQILELSHTGINIINDIFHLTGCFNSEMSEEFLYSSRFQVLDYSNRIILDSKEILHYIEDMDAEGNFLQPYDFRYTFDLNRVYTIRYTATTNNKYTFSVDYKIKRVSAPSFDASIILQAVNNYENGYIDLHLINTKPAELVNGTFEIIRIADKDNYKSQVPIGTFSVSNAMFTDNILYKDLFVEYGVSYKYGIKQILENQTSTNIAFTEPEMCLFEHIFLVGKNNTQLKIKYNPKLTQKRISQGAKIETLGSRFPFIFRQGEKNYREFTLSGLLSRLSDQEHLFIHIDNDIGYSTSLEDINYNAELQFQNTALDWLNDGNSKVLKTPDNYNAIVQLLNLNITPNDTLSRMLNEVNITAVEIAEYKWENLIDEALLLLNNISSNSIPKDKQLDITEYKLSEVSFKGTTTLFNNPKLFIAERVPVGTKFTISYFGKYESLNDVPTKPIETTTVIIDNNMQYRIDNGFKLGYYSISWETPSESLVSGKFIIGAQQIYNFITDEMEAFINEQY